MADYIQYKKEDILKAIETSTKAVFLYSDTIIGFLDKDTKLKVKNILKDAKNKGFKKSDLEYLRGILTKDAELITNSINNRKRVEWEDNHPNARCSRCGGRFYRRSWYDPSGCPHCGRTFVD